MTAEEFAKEYLTKEIQIVSRLPDIHSYLTNYEKAIIYKYTDDGFEALNEGLRNSQGKQINEFGVHLKEVLNKMPSLGELAFRGVDLSQNQLNTYLNAFKNETLITEYCFISASTKELKAWEFGSTRFKIFSEKWKNIDSVSKYINENEVILDCNVTFKVLSHNFENEINEFTMIEI